LLKKYGKEIPKTWDQLIETAIYIRDQERDLYNNTSFEPFLGGFSRESMNFFFYIKNIKI